MIALQSHSNGMAWGNQPSNGLLTEQLSQQVQLQNRMTLFRNLPIDVKISACVGEEKNRVNSVSPRNDAIVKQNL